MSVTFNSFRAVRSLAFLTITSLPIACNQPALRSQEVYVNTNVLSQTSQNHWQVDCGVFCNLEITSSSLEGLCAAVVQNVQNKTGEHVGCTFQNDTELNAPEGAAMMRAAIVQVSRSSALSTRQHSALAVQTQQGWAWAHTLGETSEAAQILKLQLVDVPGLQAPSLQVKVAASTQEKSVERMLVCGLNETGRVRCPLAATVAEVEESSKAMTAALVAAPKNIWRVDVELTSEGFIARTATGSLPKLYADFIGQHRWGTFLRD